MNAAPHHCGVTEQQRAHTADEAKRRQAVRTRHGEVGQACEDEDQIPQVQHLAVSQAAADFRKAGKPGTEVQLRTTQTRADQNLLDDQRTHPPANVTLCENNGHHVSIHKTSFNVRSEHQQPRIRCQHRAPRHARRRAKKSKSPQTHPNDALSDEEKSRAGPSILGRNQQREQHHDDQRAQPEHVVGNTGLVPQQDTAAKGSSEHGKQRVFTE